MNKKYNVFIFNKIKIDFNFFIILSILFFSARFIYKKFNYFRINFPYHFDKNLTEKYSVIDGDFYKFISFCKNIIPDKSEVLFYNSWDVYQRVYMNNAYFLFHYHKQRSKFYLYPIKVHIFCMDKKDIGRPWEIPPEDHDKILKRVNFIVACHLDREFPGFKIKYRYGYDHYLLAKEE